MYSLVSDTSELFRRMFTAYVDTTEEVQQRFEERRTDITGKQNMSRRLCHFNTIETSHCGVK